MILMNFVVLVTVTSLWLKIDQYYLQQVAKRIYILLRCMKADAV